MSIIIRDSDGCTRAGSIVIGVVGILCDGGEDHAAIRQSRRVGEPEWNSIDLSEIEQIDGGWLDRAGPLRAPRIEQR